MFLMAKVVDILDPKKMNRVKVEVLGLHTDLPKEDLKWSNMLNTIHNDGNNGIGSTVHSLNENSIVMGYFLDSKKQDFFIIGSLVGTTKMVSNVNNLAKNEEIEKTIVRLKKDNLIKNVTTGDGTTWDEPESKFNPIYPHNKVNETKSGHIFEIDDTPNLERIHNYHKSGTFEEVGPDGTKVTKILGDDYEINLKNKNLYVKGNLNITVDGSANIKAKTVNVDSSNINLGGGNKQNDSLVVQSLLDNAFNKFKTSLTGAVLASNMGGPAIISPIFTKAISTLVEDISESTSKNTSTKLTFKK